MSPAKLLLRTLRKLGPATKSLLSSISGTREGRLSPPQPSVRTPFRRSFPTMLLCAIPMFAKSARAFDEPCTARRLRARDRRALRHPHQRIKSENYEISGFRQIKPPLRARLTPIFVPPGRPATQTKAASQKKDPLAEVPRFVQTAAQSYKWRPYDAPPGSATGSFRPSGTQTGNGRSHFHEALRGQPFL